MPISSQTNDTWAKIFAIPALIMSIGVAGVFFGINYVQNSRLKESFKTNHYIQQTQIKIKYQGALEALGLDQDSTLTNLVDNYVRNSDTQHYQTLVLYLNSLNLPTEKTTAFLNATSNMAADLFVENRNYEIKKKSMQPE